MEMKQPIIFLTPAAWAWARWLLNDWSETENVVWKTATAGEGHSSPVISGNQIWLTTAITKELTPEQEKERLAKLKNSDGLKLVGTLTLVAICIKLILCSA